MIRRRLAPGGIGRCAVRFTVYAGSAALPGPAKNWYQASELAIHEG